MNYSLGYSKEVKKFLQKHRDLAPKVINALEQIAQNPFQTRKTLKDCKAHKTVIV